MPTSHLTSQPAEVSPKKPDAAPNRELTAPVQLGVPYWFHLFFPERAFATTLSILVVGGEEEWAVRVARANPRARVVALDEARPDNGLGLDERFDLIYCSDRGTRRESLPDLLAQLCDLLLPDGALHLSVTARRAGEGAGVVAQLFDRLGIRGGADSYELARALIAELPPEHPWNLASQDGRPGSDELVAGWLGPSTPGYTTGEIRELLDAAGLGLQRFTHQAYYLPQCSPLVTTALWPEVRRLPIERQQDLMELYWPWVREHCVVACRKDCLVEYRQIDFSGEAWLDYGAVLPPELRLVRSESRIRGEAYLSWAAAGVPEVGFSLGGSQFRLLQSLDRTENIHDVIAAAGLAGEAQESVAWAREFFQRMWDFDFLHFQTHRATQGEKLHRTLTPDTPLCEVKPAADEKTSSIAATYTACPLCNGTDLAPVSETSAEPLVRALHSNSARWMSCGGCGHEFSERYYPRGFQTSESLTPGTEEFLAGLIAKRPHAAQVVHSITTLRGSASGTWLDIGCGTSGLVAVAEEFGYDSTGIDCQPWAAAALTGLGYRVDSSTPWELEGPFDVVSISNGLTQDPFPEELLRRAASLLSPQGLLFAAAPARDCLDWRVLEKTEGNPYWNSPPHYHHFTRKNLFRVLRSLNLEPCGYGAGFFGPAEVQIIVCKS